MIVIYRIQISLTFFLSHAHLENEMSFSTENCGSKITMQTTRNCWEAPYKQQATVGLPVTPISSIAKLIIMFHA